MTNQLTKASPNQLAALSDYEDLDLDIIQSDIDKVKTQGSKFMKFADGKNVIRVLPGRPGHQAILQQHEHFYTNDVGEKVGHLCPMNVKQNAQRCAPCERHTELKASSRSPIDDKKAGEFAAKGRFVANVVNRSEPEKGVQVMSFGTMVAEAVVKIAKDEAAGGKFWDPLNGFDLIIEKTGQALKTKYSVLPSRNSSPLSRDQAQAVAWMEGRYDLTALKPIPSYQETLNIIAGRTDDVVDVNY